MTEPVIIALLALGSTCWAIGGIGPKYVRRFIYPTLAGVLLALSGQGIIESLCVAGALCVVNLLPYGDRTPTPVRYVVFALHMAPSLILSLWSFPAVLVATALSIGLFNATRKFNAVTHKIWEFSQGFLVAGCLVIGGLL